MSSGTEIQDGQVTPDDVKLGGYICYVHGLLVPIVSATVSYGVGKIPEATIHFFPSRHLERLGAEDRVEVVLFYLDTYNVTATRGPQYRLLFEGEIVQWSYQTTATSSSISATARADISIFESIVYGLINSVDSTAAAFTSGNVSAANAAGVFMQAGLLRDGLVLTGMAEGEEPHSTIRRPYDVLQNVLMAMAGSKNQYGDEIKREEWRGIAAINFFSRWARKRNFINRFVAVPNFDELPAGTDSKKSNESNPAFPLLKHFQSAAVLNVLLTNMGTWFKTTDSIYSIIQEIYSRLFYELQMLPTARCVTTELTSGKITGPAKGHAPTKPLRLTNYYGKPRCYFAAPPDFNVVYPSMIRSFSYVENYAQQATRVQYNDETDAAVLNQPAGSNLAPITNMLLGVGYPPEAAEALRYSLKSANNNAEEPVTDAKFTMMKAKNLLIWPEEYYRGPAYLNELAPDVFSFYAKDAANKAADANDATAYEKLRDIFQLYAECEYYTQRYNKRAGQVDMVFNPYLVQGYPTVVINRPGGLHVTGYVVEVMHSLTPTGMSTSMTYTGGRTLLEWLHLIADDSARADAKMASAPLEPIDDIRKVLQVYQTADDHYKKMYGSAQGAWNLKKWLVGVNKDGGDVTLDLTGEGRTNDNRRQTRTSDYESARPGRQLWLSDVVSIKPTAAGASLFESTSKAMHQLSRPVCTLDEYIRFRHQLPKDVDVREWMLNEKANGQTETPTQKDAFGQQKQKSWYAWGRKNAGVNATIYGRIIKFDTTPVSSDTVRRIAPFHRDGFVAGSTQPYLKAVTQDAAALPSTKYHSIRDWDRVLLSYRKEIWDDVPEDP